MESIAPITLSKLTTDGTGSKLAGMRISEETRRVLNNLADVETSSLVLRRRSGVGNTNEEWTLQAAI
jgi:hypothetical protein